MTIYFSLKVDLYCHVETTRGKRREREEKDRQYIVSMHKSINRVWKKKCIKNLALCIVNKVGAVNYKNIL